MIRSCPAWPWLPALAIALLAGPLAAADWADRREAGPFLCRADYSLDGYDTLLVELGRLQDDLVDSLAVRPARESIELYFFHDKPAYRRYLKARVPQAPDRRAVFVKTDGPGRVYVYRQKDLAVDVRHESTHALLHAALPMVPLWLDEGLAEYFEVPPAERANDNPHLAALRWNLRLGFVPRLTALEAKRDVSDMSAADYRNAWAWVHFMLHGPGAAHDELVRYLDDIHRHTPPGKLSERLERTLPGAERRLVEHFKTWPRPQPASTARVGDGS